MSFILYTNWIFNVSITFSIIVPSFNNICGMTSIIILIYDYTTFVILSFAIVNTFGGLILTIFHLESVPIFTLVAYGYAILINYSVNTVWNLTSSILTWFLASNWINYQLITILTNFTAFTTFSYFTTRNAINTNSRAPL